MWKHSATPSLLAYMLTEQCTITTILSDKLDWVSLNWNSAPCSKKRNDLANYIELSIKNIIWLCQIMEILHFISRIRLYWISCYKRLSDYVNYRIIPELHYIKWPDDQITLNVQTLSYFIVLTNFHQIFSSILRFSDDQKICDWEVEMSTQVYCCSKLQLT